MRICINHLTRMQTGCICIAGIEEESGLHIRPVGKRQLSTRLLAEHGGPIAFSSVVDLGETQFAGRMPEIEDRTCNFDHCQLVQSVPRQSLIDRAGPLASESLAEIFGPELQLYGKRTFVIPENRGLRSLGCWWAARANIILDDHGRPQFTCEYDSLSLRTPITDIRLYRGDHFEPNLPAIECANRELSAMDQVLLSVGISRPFRKSNHEPAYHWFQVNNILSLDWAD